MYVDTQAQLSPVAQRTPSLADSAVLVSLNISSWGGFKLDRSATTQLNSDKSASSDASRVNKNLMAGNSILKDIKKYESCIRARHIEMTLPWGHSGSRLLATSIMMDHKKQISDMLSMLETMWDKFFFQYPQVKADAYLHLGAMYDPNDYLSTEDLRAKFSHSLTFDPIAESGDFRIDVPKQLMEELKEQYDNAVDSRVQTAILASWKKVADQVRAMTTKLNITMDDEGKTPDGKTVRYHETFVQNIHNLCDLLVHLNVTNDPQLDQARLDLKNAVRGVSVDTLKIPTNHATRNEVKTKLDDILAKYAL